MLTDSNETVIHLTEAQLKRIVKDTVEETFLILGVDPDDPLEMQKDFRMLRDMRGGVEIIRRSSLKAFMGVLITGLLGMLWLGFKGSVGH